VFPSHFCPPVEWSSFDYCSLMDIPIEDEKSHPGVAALGESEARMHETRVRLEISQRRMAISVGLVVTSRALLIKSRHHLASRQPAAHGRRVDPAT
jgi:hypothetical protein